jgi:hypothetical protein
MRLSEMLRQNATLIVLRALAQKGVLQLRPL